MILDPSTARYEWKYKFQYQDLNMLYRWLGLRGGFRRAHNNRSVNSIYFDSNDYGFAASNMSGESDRIKIRFRWYLKEDACHLQDSVSNQTGRFELKRKSNSLSDKILLGEYEIENRQSSGSYLESLERALAFNLNSQDFGIVSPLRAVVFIQYNREYYESIYDPRFRITVDRSVRYGDCRHSANSTLLSKNYVIAEAKYPPVIDRKVEDILEDFPVRPGRMSKYLAAISQLRLVSY